MVFADNIKCPYCGEEMKLLPDTDGLAVNDTSDSSAYSVQVRLGDYFICTCQTCGVPFVGKVSLNIKVHRIDRIKDRSDE